MSFLFNNSSLKTSIRKNIDLKMSLAFQNRKPINKISINKDTSFDIFFDVYEGDEITYLYIKMEENTANAPFIYNRSYELKELYENNIIFKACDTMEEVRDYLKKLFKEKKIKIRYDENEKEEIIIMEMDAILFATPIKIEFQLYREMVMDDQKEDKLIELYNLNKSQLRKLKKIYSFLLQNKDNIECGKLIEEIKNYDIPGIEWH